MKNIVKFQIVLSALAFALTGYAFNADSFRDAGIPLAAPGQPVVPGEWHQSFAQGKAYAEEYGIPMFAVWGRPVCSHCEKVDWCLTDPEFDAWRKSAPVAKVVLVFMCEDDGINPLQGTAWWWLYNGSDLSRPHGLGNYPMCAFYWPGHVGVCIEGDVLRNPIREINGYDDPDPYTPQQTAIGYIKEKFEYYFAGYAPAGKYTEAQFEAGTNACDSLQIEIGKTTEFWVPLTRTNEVDQVGTNFVQVLLPDGTASGYPIQVTWPASGEGATRQFAKVTVPGDLAVGDVLGLSLYAVEEGTNRLLSTSKAFCVGPQENSSTNPYWIGEKDENSLAFGEWTMDLTAVTNKVKDYNRRHGGKGAYSLVLLSGSKWCPDCVKVDHNLCERPEFKAWAELHNVALGVVDLPKVKDGLDYPSLLTYRPFTVSSRYQSATVPPQEASQGGAGYLSRHGIPWAAAKDCAARNFNLWNLDTRHGGFCRPDNLSESTQSEKIFGFKTGIPCFVLLRDDGSIAGRLDEFNKTSPEVFSQQLISRLNELLQTLDDEREEANAYWSTADADNCKIDVYDGETGVLSAIDESDYFHINASAGSIKVTIKGIGANDAKVKLRVVKVEYGIETILAQTSGTLSTSSAMELDAQIDGSNTFLVVKADTTSGSPFYFWKGESSTVRSYEIATSGILEPTEELQQTVLPADTAQVMFKIVSGTSYHIEGLGDFSSAYLEKKAVGPDGETLYQGGKDGVATLPLATVGGTVSYRIWKNGSIGFDPVVMEIVENTANAGDMKVSFNVVRRGGSAGAAEVQVRLLSESTLLPDRYVWGGTTNLFWGDGQEGTKTLSFTLKDDGVCDPDQILIFELVPAGAGVVSIDPAARNLVVTIKDDDTKSVGHLAIVASEPAFARKMVVYAEESSPVTFGVIRENGAFGDVRAQLVMTAADGSVTRGKVLEWKNREENRVLTDTFTMPPFAVAKKAVVTLEALDAISIDGERKTATVLSTAAVAPAFEVDAVSRELFKGCCEDLSIPVVGLQGGKVSIVKLSGSLPRGVSCTYDEDTHSLVFSGATLQAGEFQASYRVSESGVSGIAEGRTVVLSFNVAEIPTSSSGDVPVAPNPYLAKARTVQNLMMIRPGIERATKAEGRLVGLVTFTVPSTGRASARLTCEDGTFSYRARGWSSYDAKTGEAVADLDVVSTGATCGLIAWPKTLRLHVFADGSIDIEAIDFGGVSMEYVARYEPGQCDWNIPGTAGALAWSGQYDVQMPQDGDLGAVVEVATGDASLNLRMTESAAKHGQMTFVGYLPNGRVVSGSAVLHGQGNGYVAMPFFVRTSSDVFAGALSILRDAKDKYDDNNGKNNHFVWAYRQGWPFWRHGESFKTSFGAVGAFYNKDDSLLFDCCKISYSKGLRFKVVDIDGRDVIAPVPMIVSDNNLEIASGADVNPQRVRFYLNKATGMISGTFVMPETGELATYQGVVMPGWGSCEDCVIDPTKEYRPLGSGACSFLPIGWTLPPEEEGMKRGYLIKLD